MPDDHKMRDAHSARWTDVTATKNAIPLNHQESNPGHRRQMAMKMTVSAPSMRPDGMMSAVFRVSPARSGIV